ncbi:MAG: ribosomal protein L11 methyltransferase [Bacteroidia bacterium]|jgi:ribosomal protein L11 methyltransferase
MDAFIEVTIPVLEENKEIITAELIDLGYEGFWDEGMVVKAYINSKEFKHKLLYDTLGKYTMENSFSYTAMPPQNWNEEWEKNYDPILVDDSVFVRSPFHDPMTNVKHEVVIQPQMSFGTGHHETTQLMIEMMLTIDFKGKSVLDMGTGTGVLAFLSGFLGATEMVGIDYDQNSVDNAIENLKYNAVDNVSFLYGSFEAIPSRKFDIVLSNITKNINMGLLPHLVNHISIGGYLILAGFLNFDIQEVNTKTTALGFELIRNVSKGDWECLLYKRSTEK